MDSSISIRPGVGILGLFPAMNYRAWYALAELVDNAIDSYLTNKVALQVAEGPEYVLRIVIRVEGDGAGLITVWDNAAGISEKNYRRAFVTAVPPIESAGLSQFGIGMKSASCWFAKQWRVTTSALGEPVRRRVDFDVPRIIAEEDDTLTIQASPAKESEHGTEIRLWSLHKPPQTQTIGKMRKHLASIYREYLRHGDVIIEFNGQRVQYEEPEILVAPYYKDESGSPREWSKTIDFALPTGERIRGHVGLRATGSTKFAGLALLRHGRLILGSDDEAYRPSQIFGQANSYAYQRLFGELHLDDFEVSHTKDAFIWGDREAPFLERLRAEIDLDPLPMLRQAEGYRARRPTPDLIAAATRAVDTAARAVINSQPIISSQVVEVTDPAPLPTSAQTSTQLDGGKRQLELSVRGRPWIVSIEMINDPSASEWLEITDRPAATMANRELGIRVSLSHPFTRRFGGPHPDQMNGLVRVATALAIAEITAREAGLREAGTIRRNVNELLANALSED